MMTNEVIAETLEQLADLLEFQGANPFRLRAYRNGAKKIRELPESIADLVAEDADLTEYEGIGESVAEKCQELVATGKLHQLEEILTQIPRTVLDLLRVAKVGPKKAATLYNQLGVKDLDGLEAACKAGKVRELEGFGEKTETAILEGIPLAREANKRMLWIEADVLAQQLRAVLEPCKAIRRLEFGGSYRRGKETVGDIDILVTSTRDGRSRRLAGSQFHHRARSNQDVGLAEERRPSRPPGRPPEVLRCGFAVFHWKQGTQRIAARHGERPRIEDQRMGGLSRRRRDRFSRPKRLADRRR
jgi:DNA polymerase (family 10)